MEELTVDHSQAIIIATDGLTKTFAHLTAVSNLNMEVRRGDIFGFLGPNGSGKTTTIRMLLGLLRPTTGRIQVFGMDNAAHLAEILPRVGAIVETPVFYPYLSGVDNLRIVAAASGMQLGRANQARIDEVLNLVDLGARGGDAYRKYSLGMKQRLAIAAGLLRPRELIILDEPMGGVNPVLGARIGEAVRQFAAEGRAVVVVEHNLPFIENTCHQVVVMDLGEVIAQGPFSGLRDNPRVVDAYLGMDQSHE